MTAASLLPSKNEDADDRLPFCIERQLRQRELSEFSDAVRLAIEGRGSIAFTIVDHIASPLPSGKIEFVTGTLPPPHPSHPDDPVLWRGKLFFAEGHSMPVWVRLRLWTEDRVCALARPVGRGELLDASLCEPTLRRYPAFSARPIEFAGDLEQTLAAKGMARGDLVYPTSILRRPDVEIGKPVEFRVVTGATQVRFKATAAGSGRSGQTVAVTNPSNGKRLEGQVVGQGAVEMRIQ